jgi:hypothetical protein
MDIRSRFLSLAGNLERKTILVPELGEVVVQELDGHGRASIESAMFARKDDSWKLLLICRSVIDPGSNLPVFTDRDVDQLGRLPARVLDPIFETAFRLSRMGATAVEEAEGNSQGSRCADGSSGLQNGSTEPSTNS